MTTWPESTRVTGSSKRSSSSSTSSMRCSSGSRRIDARTPIVSSNTSGIPISALAEGRSEGFRRHFLGTHFFNPPRYLHLLEVIPTPDTIRPSSTPSARSPITTWAKASSSQRTRRTSSRIISGCYGVMQMFRALERGEFTIEEIDAITGPGDRPAEERDVPHDGHRRDRRARPRRAQSGRTAGQCRRPRAVRRAAARRRVGRARAGSARRPARGSTRRRGDGEILTLDPATMEYRPKQPARLPSLDAARSDRRRRRAHADAARRAGQGRRVPARHARAHARLRRARRTRDRAHRPPTWIARCGGVSAGSWARSRRSGRCSAGAHAATASLSGQRVAAGDRRANAIAGASLRRSRRRRALRRVPLEDERDRRRHDPDAAGRRPRGGRELRGARRRQRRGRTSRPART